MGRKPVKEELFKPQDICKGHLVPTWISGPAWTQGDAVVLFLG